jgi:hypothetical protein
MSRLLTLNQFINENFRSNSELITIQSEGKLNQAADVILTFLNRKLKRDFRKFPYTIFSDGVPGIVAYSAKDKSGIRINPGGKKGIVGSIDYFSDAASQTADFSLSSENFSIVSLLDEFIRLASDKAYFKEVSAIRESVNEARRGVVLSPDVVKEVQSRLDAGASVSSIYRELDVPYSAIAKIKIGKYVPEDTPAAVKYNEQTLEDKVRILDETLEDLYVLSRKLAAGAFNSIMVSGRAGTGKTFKVSQAMRDEGLREDDDYFVISGAVSTIMMYKTLFQFRDKVIIFDDCDAVFSDPDGRNILKAALDTKKVRRISYLKSSKSIYNPKDFENDPEGEWNAVESGQVPAYFEFTGRVIFISNLAKEKADPDGAIRSRSFLIDINPDDMTVMERIKLLLPKLEPSDMSVEDKLEVYEFMKKAKDVSMRTFVKAAGLKQLNIPNWERMALRFL